MTYETHCPMTAPRHSTQNYVIHKLFPRCGQKNGSGNGKFQTKRTKMKLSALHVWGFPCNSTWDFRH